MERKQKRAGLLQFSEDEDVHHLGGGANDIGDYHEPFEFPILQTILSNHL